MLYVGVSGVKCIPRYEHYDEFVDESGLPRPGNSPLVDILLRSDLYRYYIPLAGVTDKGEKTQRVHDPIDLFLKSWLQDDPRSSVLTVLGDYGTGKSSLLLNLLYATAKHVEPYHDVHRIPFLVVLRDHPGPVTARSLVEETLAEYHIGRYSWNQFRKDLRDGRFLLLLDGFDEMSRQQDSVKVHANFEQLCLLAVGNSKVIITSRTHYFKSKAESERLLAPGRKWEETALLIHLRHSRTDNRIIELQEFDRSRIQALLRRHFPNSAARVWGQLNKIYNLRDLAKRPLLLDMIIKTILSRSDGMLSVVSSAADLYALCTSIWIDRDDWRAAMTPEGKARFMEDLAVAMSTDDKQGAMSVHWSKIATSQKSYFKDEEARRRDSDLYFEDTRTCSFLNRDNRGPYSFMHRSFWEYFLARRVIRMVRGTPTEEVLDLSKYSKETCEFVRGLGTFKAIGAPLNVAAHNAGRETLRLAIAKFISDLRNAEFYPIVRCLIEQELASGKPDGVILKTCISGTRFYHLPKAIDMYLACFSEGRH